MGFNMTISKHPHAGDAKRAAIEAARAAANNNAASLVRYQEPGRCPDRDRIVFDDSASMIGQFDNAKKGVIEFLRNCVPNQTSVAVHFMNTKTWSTSLRSDLPDLGVEIQELSLANGDTPFFNTLAQALKATPTLTRLIAFTDGAPTDFLRPDEDSELQSRYNGRIRSSWIASADIIIKIAHATGGETCIPIDTVYFGVDDSWSKAQIELLKYLSFKTGGYFLHFDPAKVNFAQAFKYLAPVNRLMLASESFRASVESGERK